MSKLSKPMLIILCVLLAIPLLFSFYLLLQGSLEAFPTAEQIEKGMIAYGVLFCIFLIIELHLFQFLHKQFRSTQS